MILSSGTGTNLQNLIDYAARSNDRIRVSGVFSDQRSRSLERARAAEIPAHHLSARDFPNRAAYDAALGDAISAYRPDLIVLSGFMRILGEAFVARFADRIVNIHPSLLPRFPGLHTHRRVLDAGEEFHGATVHFVTRELDAGPGIIQCRLPVFEHDDEASLQDRVHEVEYMIFPRAVELCATGLVKFSDGEALFDGIPMHGPVRVKHER
ncbi:MAG: phosphoribosylglycinamide formyltransferase [Rhodospirillaceae bacterium]|nr:phosphoribosylglycinamide formyltransferase [Rhodospirillaceae bacterium]